jgi:hypothetical protein
VADMQQRLRVGTDRLYNGLVVAGAGVYSGAAVGALGNFFAPILPYRVGDAGNDPPTVYFRNDDPDNPGADFSTAITIFHVPTTASQTTLRESMPPMSSELKVKEEPGCPDKDPLCGFEDWDRAVIFDSTGSYDVFTIKKNQTDATHFNHRQERLSKQYETGAIVAKVRSDTYYWRRDTATNTFQLMHYDGYQLDPLVEHDVPLIDDVVALRFEYIGEATPPVLRVPVTDPVGPWTSYGPKPPVPGVKVGAWGEGENCTFKVDPATSLQVSRLDTLGPPGTLKALTRAQLTDGPWCPDAINPNRYDADLHRIRQIRVTFRVQTGVATLRGPSGTLFSRAGTGRVSARLVPDQAVQFDVTPRNLNLGR